MKVFILVGVFLIIAIPLFIYILKSKSNSVNNYRTYQTSTSAAPTVSSNDQNSLCIPNGGIGSPSKQLNQANDSGRKTTISEVADGLKTYYSKNGKSPASLEELLNAGLIARIPKDPVTNKVYSYIPSDPNNGCIIEANLCSGSVARGYCR